MTAEEFWFALFGYITWKDCIFILIMVIIIGGPLLYYIHTFLFKPLIDCLREIENILKEFNHKE